MHRPVKQGELGRCLAEVLGLKPLPGRRDVVVERAARPEPANAPRLLLVEDDHTNQMVALGMLAKLGYGADAVGDARTALNALRDRDYALVLLDCQLPDLDGYEVARRIRWRETPVRDHDVAIVAMTAYALPGDRRKSLDAGMNDYVAKPVQPEELKRVLDQWVGRKAGAAPVPDPVATQADPPAEQAFDEAALLGRLMGDVGLARRVAAQFLEDMPGQIASLADALIRSDAHSATRAAHSIRGAAANLSGAPLSRRARRLEELGSRGDLTAVAKLMPGLEAEFGRIRGALHRFCGLESEETIR